jgi:alpha-L-fucosidase 2
MYPILKGAATFYVDVLQEEPTHKWLVVSPSMSPENTYQSNVGLSAGTTMDNQLVFDVFSNAISAAVILNTDRTLADTLKTMIKRLPPMQVGQHGQLQEWLEDWDKPNDKHRHVSHLYGLFPSNQVSPYRNPALFQAARTTLVSRGDKSTGWSMGWKVNWWARLQDGNRAYKLISDQLTPAPMETSGQNGGTYPNLFDAHPPFQIDGNFGCTSGIAEMLVQSHEGAVHILPALPDAWPDGKVTGLVTRGAFVVDIAWKNGKVKTVRVTSKLGGNFRIRSYNQIGNKSKGIVLKATGTNPNPFFSLAEIREPLISEKATLPSLTLKKIFEYDLPTRAGASYVLEF